MKQTVSEQALALVEKNISSLAGRVTPQDAATTTGISVSEARDALSRLMELYVTRVSYDDEGNLLFAFEMPLRRRGTKTAAEKWAEIKQGLWRGFKVFFKVWIGLMVVVYFLVMVVALLALIIAQSAGDRDDRDRGDRGAGNMLAGLFRVVFQGLEFAFWTRAFSGAYDYDVDSYGYRYRRPGTPKDVRGKKKSFIIAIYDLALGPERAPSDPLENEKEVAAFLRSERGVLVPAEIVALSGGSIPTAEERMADYLVRFNGVPEITDEGVVVGEFESFISGSRSEKAEGEIVPYWQEYEAPYEHSGNTTGRNVAIIGMVAFTLVVGLGMLSGGLEGLAVYGNFFLSSTARFLLGYFPIAFSVIYLLVSLLRLAGVKKKEKERLERNRKKKVMRIIFEHRLWRATADEVYHSLLVYGDKDMNREQVADILGALVLDLQGDVELGNEGEAYYAFNRLHREFEAAERLRGRGAHL